MKIQEGPFFGAALIFAGVTYLVYRKTQNIILAFAIGLGVAIADYLLVIWFNQFKQKK